VTFAEGATANQPHTQFIERHISSHGIACHSPESG
jgi:hypothetical protein